MWRFSSLIVSMLLSIGFAAPMAAAKPAQSVAFEKAIENAKNAMMADPQDALKKVDLALAQASSMPIEQQRAARATALWLKIEANIGLNRLEAARADLDEALRLANAAAPGTKLHGDLMRSNGAVAALSGRASEALRHYLDAHRIFRQSNEKRSQAIALQDIGQIYWEAGDYERMLAYYDDAQEIYDDDPAFALTGNNNRGEAYRTLGRHAEAEKAYAAALVNARAIKSPMLETRILSNLAMVQVDMGKLNQASRNAALAERLGTSAEARDWLPFVYGVKATIAARQGDDRLGASFLSKLFAGVDLQETDLTYKEFHKLAADLYSRLGQPELAFRHLLAFQRLESETRELVTSASSQLLSARFDSANQKTRIARLKQGQLERDIKIERARSTLTTALLIAALALTIVAGIAFFSIRRSRNEVRDANEVLTDVNAKLEKALKAKTDFLAMTSHEIRTPLNGIMGMTQVILADDRIDTETRERVGLVLGAGQTMQSLVNDLLDVAKMENGEISVRKEPADLRALLSNGVKLWQAQANTKGIELELVEESMPSTVYTDADRVRQVIFNLLANAIKFTAEGGVRLTARMIETGDLEILVEDSGIGIPADQLDLVFDPFHQVNNAMSRDFGGAGLGLAICRNIMTALGGTITVASVVGQGSCFRLSLPISDMSGVACSNGEAEPKTAARPALVVDNNELRLAKMKAVILLHASSVWGVQSLDEAIDWLSAQRAKILVLDISVLAQQVEMLAKLSELMAVAKLQHTSTIILLGTDEQIPRSMVEALEPDVLLEKPLKASLLIQAINEIDQPPFSNSAAA